MLTLSEEQLAAIQDRINSANKRAVRNLTGPDEERTDALMHAQLKAAKKRKPKEQKYVHRMRESQVMDAVQRILATHPKVAMFWRQNTGAAKLKGFYVKFSFKGAADWLGMLQGGRFLAVECKGTNGKASDDQIAFLKNVNDAGGFALVVDDPAQLIGALDAL